MNTHCPLFFFLGWYPRYPLSSFFGSTGWPSRIMVSSVMSLNKTRIHEVTTTPDAINTDMPNALAFRTR
jgi:hypothetical protein